MSIPRLRSSVALRGDRVDLGAAAAKHARVLRLAAGDAIVATDDVRECEATILSLDASSLIVEVGAMRERAIDAHAPILVQCVPKANKLDDVVRAATEAGVHEIHLALAARSVARAAGKLDRLERIAEEAARQCEAPRPPTIVAPAPLLEVAARAPITSARIVLTPRDGVRLAAALRGSPAWLVVGPEGGLDDDEHAALGRMGYALARLDTYVLRTEHAGPIAVALARELGRGT
jgi:16S rRNA (uracil1498-N3)-methyltransferase